MRNSDKLASLGLRVAEAALETAIQADIIADLCHFKFINALVLLDKPERSCFDEVRKGVVVVNGEAFEFLIDRFVQS